MFILKQSSCVVRRPERAIEWLAAIDIIREVFKILEPFVGEQQVLLSDERLQVLTRPKAQAQSLCKLSSPAALVRLTPDVLPPVLPHTLTGRD